MEQSIIHNQCNIHQVPAKYLCIQIDCKANTRISCGDCLIEGPHENHKKLVINQLVNKLQDIHQFFQSNYLSDTAKQKFKQELMIQFQTLKDILIKKLIIIENNIYDLIDQVDLFSNNKQTQQNIQFMQRIDPKNFNISNDLETIQFYEKIINQENIQEIINTNTTFQSLQQKIDLQAVKQIIQKPTNQLEQLQQGLVQLIQKNQVIPKEQNIQIQNNQFNIQQFKGEVIETLEEHQGSIQDIVSLDEKHFATCSMDNCIKIWDIQQPKKSIRTLHCEYSCLRSIIKMGEDHILCAQYDNCIQQWNWQTGKQNKQFQGHSDIINSMILLDNDTFLSCSEDKTIKQWKITTGKCIQSIQAHEKEIKCILKVHDNQKIVSCSTDKYLKLWDISNEQNFQLMASLLTQSELNKAIIANDNVMAVGTQQGNILIVNIDIENSFFKFISIYQLNVNCGNIWRILKLNNNYFLSCHNNGAIVIWQLNNNNNNNWMIYKQHTNLALGCIQMQNKYLITVSGDKKIKIWI